MAEFKSVEDETHEAGRKYRYVNGERQSDFDLIPNTIRRCKSNMVSITGIVLDFDKDQTIEQTIKELEGVEYVLYTTFRHTIQNHRFRVVIPFSRPLLAQDVASRQKDIKKMFPNVDLASFSVSQSFYFHSGKNDPRAIHNKGEIIDPYIFEVEKIEEPKHYTFNNQEKTNYDEIFIDHLLNKIANNTGDFKGQYDEWKTVAWATCHSIGVSNAEMLMMRYWPTKTKKEIKTLRDWKSDRSPTVGTLIKLSGISKDSLKQLDLEFKARNNITRVLSSQEAIYQLHKKRKTY